ncbi:MAG: branched-chain amino acid ABC transporter permease [Candidatus Dormibacteraeota bacterium]|nr:branched-chain amino acid ABC transporter permease [Candidatus Dormibacteraeota bacterium]
MVRALVIGLVQGSAYGLIAIGLVLVYRGSRVLNFAQAEIGTASWFIAWIVSGLWHQPVWMGMLAALLTALAIGITFERAVVRPLTSAPRLTVAVATVGLFSLLVALEVYLNGPTPRYLAQPIGGFGPQIAGIYVSWTQVLSFVIVIAVSLGLGVFLRYTDFGLGVTAAAQDPTAARLVGIPLSRVSMFTWGAAAVLGSVAALLIAPTLAFITPNAIGPQLFICGLAASLLGGLTSLTGAVVGGLLVGVVTSEATAIAPNGIVGFFTIVLFAIVMAVLLFRPQGLLGARVARAEMA